MLIKFTGCTDNKTPRDCNDCDLRWKFENCVKFRQATGRELIEKGRKWSQ